MARYSEQNTISAREGRLYLDGEELVNSIKFTISIKKKKVEAPILGKRIIGERTIGLEQPKGTITEYKATPRWLDMMTKYKDTGEEVYFTLMGVLDDASAKRGTERIIVKECSIDELELMMFDSEGDIVKNEIPFSYSDYEPQQKLRYDFD
jgi:hypothetical protein